MRKLSRSLPIPAWLAGVAIFGCAILCPAQNAASPGGQIAYAERGMVASVHPLATQAGVDVLKQGGNAIDAAVAVGLTLGVVDGENSGIGGGCFMLIRRADGSVAAIDGRETAPAAATRDMFVHNGEPDPDASVTGALAIGTPGALAAFAMAAERYGTKPLQDLIRPAAEIAERGFEVDDYYAARLKSVRMELRHFAASIRIFFKQDGSLYGKGDILRQPDLAASYRAIAREGTYWFYQGPFAEAVDSWMKTSGGVMTSADLKHYRAKEREPIVTTYRDWKILSFPPPSSGGVHVAEILNTLENFDMKALDEASRLHTIAEAMKLAFADRAYWLGDPDFAPVPRGLVDKSYGADLARRIDLVRASHVAGRGNPPGWRTNLFEKHTTHFSVADAKGNWVACTSTVNTTFGSKVVIPGTGIVMNNQMDDFSISPGMPNSFGLVGAEANAVGPGKRPLSSMSPTIVLKDGQPVLALGAAGGPTIISQVVLALVNMLDLGMTPEQAIAQPRIHHQWAPDELAVEKRLSEAAQSDLAGRGHKIVRRDSMGVTQIVGRAPDGKRFVGATDPRVSGQAEGW
jgi:gamma-glutamyltranspeptidase/glutathione hydrolase